jgi:hypothetical protein
MNRLKALCLLLVLANFNSFLSASDNLKEKYISAIIYSKWAETPLLLEASEFVHRNNPSGFWPFLAEISKSSVFEDEQSSKNSTFYDLNCKKFYSQSC